MSDFQALPKSEHHAHLFLSGSRERMQMLFGTDFPEFKNFEPGCGQAIARLNRYLGRFLIPLVGRTDFVENCVTAALEQARKDNVQNFEASIFVDVRNGAQNTPETFLAEIYRVWRKVAPEIRLKLDLGLVRSRDPEAQLAQLRAFLACQEIFPELLGGVDLYDVEDARAPEAFVEHFRLAGNVGLRRKAHIGEFGGPVEIRKTLDVLDLDEIQHGIHACESPELMRELSRRGTILNVSPASNRALGAMDFSRTPHPLRVLYDFGVRFTLSTDDFLLFDTPIGRECEELFRSGIFTREELYDILSKK